MNRMHIAASFAGLIRTLQKPKGGNSTISSVRHLKHLRTWKNLWSLDSLGLPENRFSTKLSKMVIPSGHASHFQTHPDVHVDSMLTLSQHPRLSSTTLWPTWPWTTVVPAFSRATTCSLFPLWKVTDFFSVIHGDPHWSHLAWAVMKWQIPAWTPLLWELKLW